MATPPQTAHLTGTVSWASGGGPFDGYLLLGLVLPTNGDGVWPSISLYGAAEPQRLPLWATIVITQGTFDPSSTVFFNAQLDPPNCRYVAYWYDRNWRRIYPASGVLATAFDITTDPYAISIPTLTPPTAGVVMPSPETA